MSESQMGKSKLLWKLILPKQDKKISRAKKKQT